MGRVHQVSRDGSQSILNGRSRATLDHPRRGKGEKDQRIVRSRKKRGVELVEHATIPEDLPEVMRPVSCPREPKRCATNHEIKVYDIGGMGRLGHGRGDVEAMEGVAGCREV